MFVSHFQFFIKDNQGGGEVTQLDYLGFIGSPVSATNMSDFKRVSTNGQRHTKRDLRTYAKSVDPDQPPRLRRRVWSGSALFDTCHINGTYISCSVNILITYRCFQHLSGADLGLHNVKCPKVPFRVTLANYKMHNNETMPDPKFLNAG